MTERMRLLAMKAPLHKERAILRLLEPAGSCRNVLWERLFNGTYDKPFIIDRGVWRFLHFDLFAVQSAMNLLHPERLSLNYTRKMMTFLLFNPEPARILLLGLGGGSLAKFCYWHLPQSSITAVEVNPDVIALRKAFCVPENDARFRVIQAEGADYVARAARSKDVILADACDRNGIAAECDSLEFYQHVYHMLDRGGVFITNLCSEASATHVRKIRTVFGEHCLTLRARRDGNLILLALKEPCGAIDWPKLEAGAIALKRRLGLDFPRYVRRVRQGHVASLEHSRESASQP